VKPLPAQTAPPAALAWLVVPLLLLLGGCSHISGWWPWHHKNPTPPESVNVLVPSAVGDTALIPVSEFWDGNALRIELGALSGSGSLQLTRAPRQAWPVRVEFRVLPGSARQLEINAAQRVVFAIPASGALITFILPPGAYTPTTKTMTVSWEP
jgi:hypothetical protein